MSRSGFGGGDRSSLRPHVSGEGKHRLHWGEYYASPCFSVSPDGRVVQIGCARIDMPDMPFNQTFIVPSHLTLRTTGASLRMFAEPIEELKRLRQLEPQTITDRKLMPEAPSASVEVEGQLFDIEVVLSSILRWS